MNAKEYLSQAFRLDQRINSKLEQVASLRDLAAKVTASYTKDRVDGTKQRSPMENAIVKIIDLEYEIDADIDELVDLKREIIKAVKSVQQPEYQLLLELRYLSYKTWEETAEMMNYSWRNIHYIHAKALMAIKIDRSLHGFAQVD